MTRNLGTDAAPWAHRRYAATTDAPRTQPPRPQPLDVAAIEAYTAGVLRAREEYEWHPFVYSCQRYHRCPYRLRRGVR